MERFPRSWLLPDLFGLAVAASRARFAARRPAAEVRLAPACAVGLLLAAGLSRGPPRCLGGELPAGWPGEAAELLRIARHADLRNPEEREEALGALRRLQEAFPERSQDENVLAAIETVAGWSFGSVQARARVAGGRAEVTVAGGSSSSRSKRPPSTWLTRWMSAEAFRRLLDATAPGRLPIPRPGDGDPATEETHELGAGERGWDLPWRRGAIVVEERVDGFRRLHLVQAATFDLFVKTWSGGGFVLAVDPETGRPVEGVEMEARTLDGRGEGRTDADGLWRFELRGVGSIVGEKGGEIAAVPFEAAPLEADTLAHIAMDRCAFLPGQTVRWKAIVRERRGASFSIPPLESVSWQILGPERETVRAGRLPLSEAGSAAGSFRLPEDARPGLYALVLDVRGRPWRPWFRTGSRRELCPWSRTFCVRERGETALTVAATLDSDPRDALSDLRGRLNVTGEDGRPVEGARAFWSVVARFERKVPADGNWLPARSLDARPVQELVTCPIWSTAASDRTRPGIIPLSNPMTSSTARDLCRGGEFALAEVYLLARVADARGRMGSLRLALPTPDIPPPAPANARANAPPESAPCSESGFFPLDIACDRQVYEEGDRGQLTVLSSFEDQPALLILEAEDCYLEARPICLETGRDVVSFTVPEGVGPDLTVHVLTWRKGEMHSASHSLVISPRRRALGISISVEPAPAAARHAVRIRLGVTASGRPAQAEVELVVVDAAVSSLAPDTSIDIRDFFYYAWREGAFYEGGEDALLQRQIQGDLQVLWDFWDGPELEPLPPPLYWNGAIVTDQGGRAEIDVEVPDRAATYRVMARAVSGTDRFGWAAATFRGDG